MSDNEHNAILHANLDRVFNERVAARRIVAIRELYREDAELHEVRAFCAGPRSYFAGRDGPACAPAAKIRILCDQASTEPSWRWPAAMERRAPGRPRRGHRH